MHPHNNIQLQLSLHLCSHKFLVSSRHYRPKLSKKDEAHNVLVRELTEEIKNNKVLLTRLTQEVKTLRVELSQIKQQSTVMPLKSEGPLKALPLTTIDAVSSFDNDLQHNQDTLGAFVS